MVTATVTVGGLDGSGGVDDLTGIAQPTGGQIHIYGRDDEDAINLGFSSMDEFSAGHHVRGDENGSSDRTKDTFDFQNLHRVDDIIVGRIEDFDPTLDILSIEGVQILPNQLESGSGTTSGYSWRVVEYDSDDRDSALNTQQWLLIDTGQGYAQRVMGGHE